MLTVSAGCYASHTAVLAGRKRAWTVLTEAKNDSLGFLYEVPLPDQAACIWALWSESTVKQFIFMADNFSCFFNIVKNALEWG